jgi:hypothetical protein
MHKCPIMTIIGFGRMGKKFTEFFAEGFDVQVVSSRNVASEVESLGARCARDLGDAIRSSDYIFVAVPIYALDSVVERINEYVDPSAMAFDICGVRTVADEKMSRLKCRRFAINGHSILGSPDPVILQYLEQRGYSHQPTTVEDHEYPRPVVGLAHFIGMVLDSYLQDTEKETMTHSPAATNLLKLIDHLRSNSPATYWETQICNPGMEPCRKEFIKACIEYDKRLSAGEFPFADELRFMKF